MAAKSVGLNALDEQIRKLEEALGGDEDDRSVASDDDNVDEESSHGVMVERDANGNVLRLVSSLVTEKIAPLPATQLPLPMCSRGSGSARVSRSVLLDGKRAVRFVVDSEGLLTDEIPSKKYKGLATKFTSSATSSSSSSLSSSSSAPSRRMPGLEHAVHEMLVNYQPSSAEKRPYWCRICRVQSTDIDEFNSHMQSELHQVAVKMERKMSFCKICRKQFNSPDQLKGHLKGKLHIMSTVEQSRRRSTTRSTMSFS